MKRWVYWIGIFAFCFHGSLMCLRHLGNLDCPSLIFLRLIAFSSLLALLVFFVIFFRQAISIRRSYHVCEQQQSLIKRFEHRLLLLHVIFFYVFCLGGLSFLGSRS